MHPVDQVLAELGADHRVVAPGEWGVTFEDVGGWPLDVGLRDAGGLLRVQAELCGPDAVDPHWLLHRSRLGELVRLTHSSAGAVWVQAELVAPGLQVVWVERVLAAVVQVAGDVRAAAAARGG
ncbi:hypothetical protein [Conexibacter sp. SYSU D00693]|uniref:hypothetical protein n=1 Tax=Conexibacter sp. SYSU D00693 TaxID=2812560 RepID=UPI00196B50E2|nr:hypothetical protein [Conexibacter sp. SYSU D00693]